jgi:hypothetical protein
MTTVIRVSRDMVKVVGILLLAVLGFWLLSAPVDTWLPFSDRFPQWMIAKPIIYWIGQALPLIAVLVSLAGVILFLYYAYDNF